VRVYQFRHTGPAHDPEEIVADAVRDGAAFSGNGMCQEAPLYIRVLAASMDANAPLPGGEM
jgi:hypothetical protein